MTYTEDDLTPWFPPDVKPVHQGVYEVDQGDLEDGRCFAYWDGSKFKCRAWEHFNGGIPQTIIKAAHCSDLNTMYSNHVCWRGLNKQP